MLLVKRSNKPLVIDAIAQKLPEGNANHQFTSLQTNHGSFEALEAVNAVMAAMNEAVPASFANSAHPGLTSKPVANGVARHEDILKF